MRKYRSKSEMDYMTAYCQLRRLGGSTEIGFSRSLAEDATEAATLSYDYYESLFFGWINLNRMYQFKKRQRQLASLNRFPF